MPEITKRVPLTGASDMHQIVENVKALEKLQFSPKNSSKSTRSVRLVRPVFLETSLSERRGARVVANLVSRFAERNVHRVLSPSALGLPALYTI